jgi:hypothetical protein
VLSPVSGVCCHRRRRDIPAGLTPRSRRQDHTTSPYAAAFSSGGLFGRDPYRKTGFHFSGITPPT